MKKIVFGLIVAFSFGLQSCSEMEIPDPNPGGFDGIDFKINISQNPYTGLQKVNGSVIVEEHKVIIARLTQSDWFAHQSYCPNDKNTNLNFVPNADPAKSTFVCPKDNSVYSYNGAVVSGNSTALKSYFTSFAVDSNTLRVFE